MAYFILNSKSFEIVLILSNKNFFVCYYDQFGNPPHHFEWTIQSIRLSFDVPLQTVQDRFCLSTLLPFIRHTVFFVSLPLLVILVSSLFFLFGSNLIFISFFSWFCCNFCLQDNVVIISDFSSCRFVRLTNLGTIKIIGKKPCFTQMIC